MDIEVQKKWGFKGNRELSAASVSVRGVLNELTKNINQEDQRPLITLASNDPSVFTYFQTTSFAADAIVDAVRSFQFNGYCPSAGVASARRFLFLFFLIFSVQILFLHIAKWKKNEVKWYDLSLERVISIFST